MIAYKLKNFLSIKKNLILQNISLAIFHLNRNPIIILLSF